MPQILVEMKWNKKIFASALTRAGKISRRGGRRAAAQGGAWACRCRRAGSHDRADTRAGKKPTRASRGLSCLRPHRADTARRRPCSLARQHPKFSNFLDSISIFYDSQKPVITVELLGRVKERVLREHDDRRMRESFNN